MCMYTAVFLKLCSTEPQGCDRILSTDRLTHFTVPLLSSYIASITLLTLQRGGNYMYHL
jgi:hypothetical protein